MKKLTLCLSIFTSFILISCNKDNNEVVNKISGSWELQYYIVGEDTTYFTSINIIQFNDCKLKKNNEESYCDGSLETSINSQIFTKDFQYRIEDAGKTMLTKQESQAISQAKSGELIFLTDERVRINGSHFLDSINTNNGYMILDREM